MEKEYMTVAQFANIRGVSQSTIKRRIHDATLKRVKKIPGPFEQDKYMIHRSELSIPQKDLFGPKRSPIIKDSRNVEIDESQVLLNNTELALDIRYLRKTIDIASKRLEAIELAFSKQ